jgi:uncharacterized membrane protein YhaH (DUF805 family)
MEYFISIDYKQSGPYSLGQLESMVKSGQVTLSHRVKRIGSNNWLKITEVSELNYLFGGTASPNTQAAPVQPPFAAPVQPPPAAPLKPERKLRHGFTSFYLWAGFLFGCLASLIVIADVALSDLRLLADIFPQSSSFDLWVIRIFIGVLTISFRSIIDWDRSGFWWYSISTVVYSFLDPVKGGILGNLIGSAVSIGILYGVLHFHNAYNAKSTWEQLKPG